jgi:hypothetical protein
MNRASIFVLIILATLDAAICVVTVLVYIKAMDC